MQKFYKSEKFVAVIHATGDGMGHRYGLFATALVLMALLDACAPILSQVANDGPTPDGIPYFLPRRPFVVTVSVPAGGDDKNAAVTVAAGVAEPDLGHRYVMSQGANWLAKNEMNISVGANGLLKTSNGTATSEVATAVQNLAGSVAMMGGVPPVGGPTGGTNMLFMEAFIPKTGVAETLPPGPDLTCPPAGSSYQFLIYPESRFAQQPRFCGQYIVTWRKSNKAPVANCSKAKADSLSCDNEAANRKHDWFGFEAQYSGLFFRHELPYVVTVCGPTTTEDDPACKDSSESDQPPSVNKNQVVLTSPDESETDFFPINRSFFANNSANVTITDGVITAVDQTTDGEVAAFVGLPAAWVNSYTTALGSLFTGLTTNSSDQQKLIQQMQATAASQATAQAQYQVCRKTMASYDFTNMTPAQAAAAATAIKAACSGN